MRKDTYSCFADLKKAEGEKSFDITCEMENRSSIYAIMAPHGGGIEPGTTEISIAIALDDLSFYIFNAKKLSNNKTLHITSACFDEPKCEAMLKNVETVLGIHGAADPDTGPKELVWVGGNLRKNFEIHLKETLKPLGFLVEFNPNLAGGNPQNICNRGTSKQGMQLELTKSLRNKLKDNPDLLCKFSDAVRRAMKLTYPTV